MVRAHESTVRCDLLAETDLAGTNHPAATGFDVFFDTLTRAGSPTKAVAGDRTLYPDLP
jgi:hypothetical protein